VNLIVGGFYYSLDPLDIERFPDSYFSHLLKDEWNRDKYAAIRIDRDGKLFRFVSSYIHVGVFESGEQFITLEQYVAIRREADFYNLPSMVKVCDEKIFLRMQYDENYTGNVTSNFASPPYPLHVYDCEQEFGKASGLMTALTLRPPVAAATVITLSQSLPTFSHIERLRINHSLSHNCFGVTSRFLGTTSVMIEAANIVTHWPLFFDENTLLRKITPTAYLYTTGGHCASRTYMFSNEYPTMIGAVIMIPDSCVYTGGKITATTCGQSVSIDKPGECMALALGAQYSVETVTSGELVIFEVPIVTEEKDTESDTEEESIEYQRMV